MTSLALDAANVSITLAGRPVVRRVDLGVALGEFVTLLGTNGSGKSTLVRACVGLLPLASGTVNLFGSPVGSLRHRRRIGYVPQRATASSGVPATVGELVMTGRLAHRRLAGWSTRADRDAVAAALHQVGLTERVGDSVARLSGGQQQRVLIARALAGGADLLVLDEPTAGVDAGTQAVLARVLEELVAHGVTVLLVAHELGPLAPLVDRAVVLRDGRVQFDGPVAEVPSGLESLAHDHPHSGQPIRAGGLHGEGIWR